MISVIIPNYNYSNFLEKRLESVLAQSVVPGEIIFLDDASSDNSVEIAEGILSKSSVPYKIIVNEINSGSVYHQWQKGYEIAKGHFIWIAEADDAASPLFLNNTSTILQSNPSVGLVFSETSCIDKKNNIYNSFFYSKIHKNINRTKWNKSYIDKGCKEIETAIAARNTIPNVSAVLFRKAAVDSIGGFEGKYRYSDDWWTYIKILEKWNIAYLHKRLNFQRFHNQRVTSSFNSTLLQSEEAFDIFSFCMKHYTLSMNVQIGFLWTLFQWIESSNIDEVEVEALWQKTKTLIGEEIFNECNWKRWHKRLTKDVRSDNIWRKIKNYSFEKLLVKLNMRHI